jgi:malonate decarboxylase gamma subunit
MNEQVGLRGRVWFKALTGSDTSKNGDPKSVLAATTDFRKEHVKSQAYGRREETAGIFLAAATAADAYASARMAGHPVISLVAGHAFSGGFLTHGYQANRILSFDDSDNNIHAMHKEAAARITRRSVSQLEKLGHEIAPMSYDVENYAKLGILFRLLHVEDPQIRLQVKSRTSRKRSPTRSETHVPARPI